MSIRRIYAVDDYPLAAYTIKKTVESFSKHECVVSDFESPIVLLDKFKKEFKNIDMIITDYEMPELCGNDLINQLRAIKPEIKVVVISAWLDSCVSNDQDLIEKKVKALDPNLILSKPFPKNWVKNLDKILDT